MALTISTGFVVDDAIVMIENISRYIEAGESPMRAALKGSEQIGFTIMSLTVSLIAVLIPLLFMSDVVGRLFREFAITLAVTILVSAVVSLTLTPMMCSRILQDNGQSTSRRASTTGPRKSSTAVIAWYGRDSAGGTAPPLHHPDGHHRHTCGHHPALHRGSQGLLPGAGYGRDPRHQRSAADRSASPTWRSRQQKLVDIVLQDPAVDNVSSFIGVDGTNTTLNSGRIQITLKPLE